MFYILYAFSPILCNINVIIRKENLIHIWNILCYTYFNIQYRLQCSEKEGDILDRLDNIRQRQRRNIERQIEKEEKRATESSRSRSPKKRPAQKKPAQNKKRKTNSKLKSVLRIAAIVAAVGVITATAAVVWATWGMDFDFADSFNRLGLNLSSVVYYTDDDGNMAIYEQLIADENRIWADYDNIPQDMKNAFVAIEDQRFYKHHGVDIKRTAGAVINVIFNGDSSYGGSTITQ